MREILDRLRDLFINWANEAKTGRVVVSIDFNNGGARSVQVEEVTQHKIK